MATKVMAFGSFDILHLGHIHYLKRAAALGDHLIVVVARDSSIRAMKKREPIFKERERAKLVESLRMVDKAVVGNRIRSSRDFYKIIKKHRPNVIAFGYDQHVDIVRLKAWLDENGIRARVVRIRSSLDPRLYKSSKIRDLAL